MAGKYRSLNRYIYYGNGDISIQYSNPIKAFDIKLKGIYNLESYEIDNFLINYNNQRLIGVSLGGELGNNPFLKYTGDLQILECKIITSDMKKVNIAPKMLRLDTFQSTIDSFDGKNINFEDMNHIGVVGDIPKKIKINLITKNLHTEGEQYTLDGQNYKGYYHLHHNGVAMTGKDHNESSEVLTPEIKKYTRERIN